MSRINKLFFTFFLLFTFFFINSCKEEGNFNEEYLSVTSTNPKNSEANISTDTKIVIVLNKSFENIQQNTITNNALTILDSDDNIVAGTINMVGNNLIFQSSQKLKENEKYTVTLGKNIKDLDGNTLQQDYTYSFTTKQIEIQQIQQTPEDNNQTITLLKVISTIPNDRDENVKISALILLTFNESIDENSVGNDNLSVLDTNGNMVNGSIMVVDNRIMFNILNDLAYDTKYQISLAKSIKGKSGANLNSIYSFSFTTKKEIQENTNPSKPPNIITSNITKTSIKISWNGSIDSDGSIDSYYVSYKKGNGLYYSEIQTTDTFKIFTSLESNTSYTFKVRAKDNDGDFSDYAIVNGRTLEEVVNESSSGEATINETSNEEATINESFDSTSKDIEDMQIHKSHIYTLSDSEILKISINDATDITKIPLSGTGGSKGFAISSNGDIFIANTLHNKITKLLASNNYAIDTSLAIHDAGHRVGELYHPYDVSVDGEGKNLEVIVLDSGNNRVQIFDYVGIYLASFDGSSSADGKLNNPLNIIGSNTMIITDSGNNMIRAMSYNHRTQKLESKKLLSLENFGKVTYSSNGILVPDNTNKQLMFMYLHGEQIKTIPTTQDIHIAIAYHQNNSIAQVAKSPREIIHKTIPKTPIELAPTALTKKFIKAYLDEDDESMLKIASSSLIEKLKTIRDKVVTYFKFIEKYRESIYFYGMKAVVFGLVISPEHNITESTNIYLKFDYNWIGDKWVLVRVF